VIRADRGSVLVATSAGIERAELAAALRREAHSSLDLPATGDWLVLHRPDRHEVALIEAVLPRTSAFTRGDPGEASVGQVLAANVDVVFVVQPLDTGPNLRRIERELALGWESGATPVVVLTKADLSADPQGALAAVEEIALGVDTVLASSVADGGIEHVRMQARAGATIALIGPSGAGKSTLVNALLGEERQATREVRVGDGKGRHTTVTRELIPLPGGGVLMDTPGMRAMAVHELAEGLDAAFSDIAALSADCRFRDCTHNDEPGCAVAKAVVDGALPPERLASYHKLQREAVVAAMKTDARLRAEEVRKWKIIHKSMKGHDKRTGSFGG
jgi:ribosome biogenesis GTPase